MRVSQVDWGLGGEGWWYGEASWGEQGGRAIVWGSFQDLWEDSAGSRYVSLLNPQRLSYFLFFGLETQAEWGFW